MTQIKLHSTEDNFRANMTQIKLNQGIDQPKKLNIKIEIQYRLFLWRHPISYNDHLLKKSSFKELFTPII